MPANAPVSHAVMRWMPSDCWSAVSIVVKKAMAWVLSTAATAVRMTACIAAGSPAVETASVMPTPPHWRSDRYMMSGGGVVEALRLHVTDDPDDLEFDVGLLAAQEHPGPRRACRETAAWQRTALMTTTPGAFSRSVAANSRPDCSGMPSRAK